MTLFDATSVVVADTESLFVSFSLARRPFERSPKNREEGGAGGNTANLHVGRIWRGRSESTLRAESFGGWLRPRAEAGLFSVFRAAGDGRVDTPGVSTRGEGCPRQPAFPSVRRDNVSVAGNNA